MNDLKKFLEKNPANYQLNFLFAKEEEHKKESPLRATFYNSNRYYTQPFYKKIRTIRHEHTPVEKG